MTPAEEDALVNEIFEANWRTEAGQETSLYKMAQAIRLAIRAANEAGRLEGAAQERERCAKVCERYAGEHFEERADECAAAIRRGE